MNNTNSLSIGNKVLTTNGCYPNRQGEVVRISECEVLGVAVKTVGVEIPLYDQFGEFLYMHVTYVDATSLVAA